MAIEPGPQFNPENFGFAPGEAEEMAKRVRNEHNQGIMKGLEETMFGPGGLHGAFQNEAAHRLRHMPNSHTTLDEDGELHVSHTDGGWTTKWWGGKYAEHSHPKHGTVDVTDMAIKLPNGEEHLPTELNLDDIKRVHNEFLDYHRKNGPKDMQ